MFIPNSFCELFFYLLPSLIGLVGTFITIKFSEHNINKSIHANAKPYIYTLDYKVLKKDTKFPTDKTFHFNAKDIIDETFSIPAYIKNTNNGVAIIKKITFDSVDYFPDSDCVIDKGRVIKVILNCICKETHLLKQKITVSDIFGNTYTFPIKLKGESFYTVNNTASNGSQNHSSDAQIVNNGNITNNSGIIGHNNTTVNLYERGNNNAEF